MKSKAKCHRVISVNKKKKKKRKRKKLIKIKGKRGFKLN